MTYLDSQERRNYLELTNVFAEIVNEFADKGKASYHAPHGIAAFCYTYLQRVFTPEMDAKATALYKQALQEAVDGVDIEEGEKVDISLEALGPVFRQTFELLVLIGYEFAQKGYTLKSCACIEDVGENIEAALRKGTWERGL